MSNQTQQLTDTVWYYINWKEKTASLVPGINPPQPHPLKEIVIRKFDHILSDEEIQAASLKVAKEFLNERQIVVTHDLEQEDFGQMLCDIADYWSAYNSKTGGSIFGFAKGCDLNVGELQSLLIKKGEPRDVSIKRILAIVSPSVIKKAHNGATSNKAFKAAYDEWAKDTQVPDLATSDGEM